MVYSLVIVEHQEPLTWTMFIHSKFILCHIIFIQNKYGIKKLISILLTWPHFLHVQIKSNDNMVITSNLSLHFSRIRYMFRRLSDKRMHKREIIWYLTDQHDHGIFFFHTSAIQFHEYAYIRNFNIDFHKLNFQGNHNCKLSSQMTLARSRDQ